MEMRSKLNSCGVSIARFEAKKAHICHPAFMKKFCNKRNVKLGSHTHKLLLEIIKEYRNDNEGIIFNDWINKYFKDFEKNFGKVKYP